MRRRIPMSCYKLNVKLAQATPLLHFQGKELGACLRASEVKPALDRFLLACLSKDLTLPDSWYNKENHAFRYRMTFRGCKVSEKAVSHPLYFANANTTRAVWYSSMTMDILSLSPEKLTLEGTPMTLLDVIARFLPPFFALHCFGARSNKGFGSFVVKEINRKDVPELESIDSLTKYAPTRLLYCLDYGSAPESKTVLDEIALLSDIMKGGVNETHGNPKSDLYLKGLIFQYFMETSEREIHTEKALIKNKLLNDPQAQEEDAYVQEVFGKKKPQQESYRYIRALLGLPGVYQYKIDPDNPNSYRAGKVFLKDVNRQVERFENPVHYKPHGRYLLIIPQNIPRALLGADFSFYLKGEGGQMLRAERIQTPKEFSLDDFLQYFCKRIKEDESVYRFLGGPREISRFPAHP